MGRGGKKLQARNVAKTGRQQEKTARTLDTLAEFDYFSKSIFPQLKKAVMEGWSSEKMRKQFAPFMQALMIEKGFKGDFKAMKDVLDRHEGMAIQRVEQKTVYAKMEKKEMAALMLQKLYDARIIDTTGRVIIEEPEDEKPQ